MKNLITNKKIQTNLKILINEFLTPGYLTDQLISYSVLYFSLTNNSVAVDVFPELFVDPFAIKNLFYVISDVK